MHCRATPGMCTESLMELELNLLGSGATDEQYLKFTSQPATLSVC
jgi:hypothetical protein